MYRCREAPSGPLRTEGKEAGFSWGDCVVTASRVLRRLGRTLFVGAAAVLMTGCGITSSQMGDASPAVMPPPPPPYRYERGYRSPEAAPPYRYHRSVIPPEQPAKPVDATEEMQERHPSMWKRKLRAMYALM